MGLTDAAILLNMAITILALGGGYLAFRNGKHQQTSTLQSQAIEALKAELEVLQHRIETIEKENTRLNQLMNLIRSALKKRGLNVTIEGDLVIIDDGHGNSSQYSHIQEDGK